MIRPIKDINARPQIEWYTEYSSTSGGPIVHKKEYDMALEIYCDHLEKALDKACVELENLSCVKGLGQVGMCYAEWKEYLLKGGN